MAAGDTSVGSRPTTIEITLFDGAEIKAFDGEAATLPVPVPAGPWEVGKRNWEPCNPSVGLAPTLLQLRAIKQSLIKLVSF